MSQANKARFALITGASSGIGYELAHVFAKNGWNLVLVARRLDRLLALSQQLSKSFGVSVFVIEKDLTKPQASEELFRETSSKNLVIDALVNNAGVATYGMFSRTELKAETDLLEINIGALTKLSKFYLRPMLERKKGWILNVASTAAFQPGPLMAVYYASKAYVLSFSEALANELEGTGVSVTALCPGATKTEFKDAAKMGDSKLFQKQVMSAERVAQEGYRGMMRRKTIVIPGVKNTIMASSVRWAPRWLVPRVVRRLQETRS